MEKVYLSFSNLIFFFFLIVKKEKQYLLKVEKNQTNTKKSILRL